MVVDVGGLVVVVLGGGVGVLARLPSGPGRAEVTGDVAYKGRRLIIRRSLLIGRQATLEVELAI